MTPYWHDAFLTVYEGDCRAVMAQMEPESVHCVVTSPPYWGLRDYGTAAWIGGDEDCDHKRRVNESTENVRREGYENAFRNGASASNHREEPAGRDTCPYCGATRVDKSLGLEPTPEQYVENMVAVFREVRRVLRKDGTCWVNLGDSYANAEPRKAFGDQSSRGPGAMEGDVIQRDWSVWKLKQKDLAGMPWRVAFALQADGWYLRSDIIWSKPNPMPESVTDRPTKAHEYLFLLTKSPRYYFDQEAVRDPAIHAGKEVKYGPNAQVHQLGDDVNDRRTATGFARGITVAAGRNLRTVWTIATQPYPGAHFATFPEALVEPCVKAGTSERGVCPDCGAPWVRQTTTEYVKSPVHGSGSVIGRHDETGANGWDGAGMPRLNKEVTTVGWRPDCICLRAWEAVSEAGHTDFGRRPEPVPATVLDPFAGSGTTGRVAQRLGRRAVLIDLSGEYLKQAMTRNQDIPLGMESA